MNASVKIGHIWGIPIGLHTSWFLVFALTTWSLGRGYFPNEYPGMSNVVNFSLGLITSLLFFGSVLGHELGHSVIALRNQIPVKGITLFIFGGVAQISQEPRSPGAEFFIAIAGPAVSLGLSGAFGGLYLLAQSIPFLAAPSLYLMRINLVLALFNLIPGFPLDGGRVLRALIWKFTRNFQRSTHIASLAGQLVAFGFIGIGIWTIINGQLFNGLWLIFIGWFLQNAAASTYAQLTLQNTLRGVKVFQVMQPACTEVPTHMPVSQLVQEYVLSGGQRCFYVTDNGQLVGMLTLKDITNIPQAGWRDLTVGQAMLPIDRLTQVEPDTELLTALQTMDNANFAQVPVVEQGRLVGTLSREQVVHYLRVRAELKI